MKLRLTGIPLNVPSECKSLDYFELLRFAKEKEQSSSRDSFLDDYSDDSYGNFYNNPLTPRIRNVRFN